MLRRTTTSEAAHAAGVPALRGWWPWSGMLMLLVALPGCAGWKFKNPLPIAPDVHAKREERRAELVKEYEQKRALALLNAAQTRLQQGDEAGAKQSLNQLLALNPNHLEGRLLHAELLLMSYELEEAKQVVEGVLTEQPDQPQALHTMGLIEEALGQGEEAAEYFGRAAELAPEDPLVTLDYESTIDPRYSQPGAMPEKTALLDAQGNEISAASSVGDGSRVHLLSLEQATSSPRTVALLRRAMVAMTAGESDEAIAQLRQAMTLEPENLRLYRQVALEALRSNHPEVASATLQTALKQLPQSSELYRLYGLSLYRQQQFRPAEIALRQAVSLDNRDALAYFLLGQALARLGQADQSQEFLQEACRLDSSLSAQTQAR